MAIVSISRITQRQGLEDDLPQPLAGAELGWAVDQRKLFIGNGTLIDGAPVVGNTEILTEFSDILGFSTLYTYKGEAAGYTVQTGPTLSDPTAQSLQSRLDSIAVVTDFGAVGDGETDDTEAINRALFELFCVQANTQIRRSLFFPGGTYSVTDTIKVPDFAKLYGEGAQSSIISFNVQNWVTLTAYGEGVLVYYTVNSTYYRSNSVVPVSDSGNPITPSGFPSYWTAESLPDYIMRTADSKCQTGANIGTNAAIAPRNIEISSMAFHTNMIHDGVLMQDATQCYFDSVDIIGPLTPADLTVTTDDIAALRFASTASLICKQITFDKCEYSGFTYGINTAQQVQGITVSNGIFTTLHQGVVLGGASPVNGGPTGFRILHNTFDTIYNKGVVISGVSLNATGYNIFYDVGNEFNGSTSPSSSIIDIDADNNVSIGDMFERTTAYSGTYPRINLNFSASIGITNAVQIQLGTYVREIGLRAVLDNNVSATTIFTINALETRAFKIDYTIVRVAPDSSGSVVRTGTFTVVGSINGTGDTLISSDSSIENDSVGVTFSVTEAADVVSFKYATTNTGVDGILHYSVTHLA